MSRTPFSNVNYDGLDGKSPSRLGKLILSKSKSSLLSIILNVQWSLWI